MSSQSSEDQNEVLETKTPKSVARIKAKLQKLHLWIEKYHRSLDLAIKIVGVAAAVAAAVFVLCQIHQMRRQTKAIWYANRPALRIHPIDAQKDIQPYGGIVKTPMGSFSDSTLFFELTTSIENAGNSPALIDTIYYELADQDAVISDTASYCVLPLSPKDVVAETMKLLLRKDKRSIFAITIVYYWEKRADKNDNFRLNKYFIAYYAEDSWHVRILSSAQYSLERANFLKGKTIDSL